MCHNRRLNSRVNRIHERALRIVFQDKNLSFQQLLVKANMVEIHHRNLQILATELFKVKNDISPPIMKEVFPIRDAKYNFRKDIAFNTRNIRSVIYGTESLTHLGPKIWALIPDIIKDSKTLPIFKSKIKTWIPDHCPCRLCKSYIPNLGFI